MLRTLILTDNNRTGLILRITLGGVVFAHGAQKLLGWFGGFGFMGTMQYFTETAHLPYVIGFLVIMAEFFGSLLLIAGLATRFNAAILFVIFIGVIAIEGSQYGFFMNWFNNQKGEGIEFSLLALGISLALATTGGGRYSIDRLITQGNTINKSTRIEGRVVAQP